MSCTKKVLASRDKFGSVYECACGAIHISIGAVDIKFSRGGLLEIQAMLTEAVEQIKPHSTEIVEAVHLLMDGPQPHVN